MKKLLFISQLSLQDKNYFYGDSFAKIFQKNRYRVSILNCRLFSGKLWQNLFLNILFLFKVATTKPDVIFLLKAENISYLLLKYCKKWLKFKLVNFYPDSPFAFFNGNSNANIMLSLPLYDNFLIWNKAFFPALNSAGCKNITYFPFFPELEMWKERNVKLPTQGLDLNFVGTWDQKRERTLTKLLKALPKIKVGIFGNGWQKSSQDLREKLFLLKSETINSNQMSSIFYHSKVSLNILKPQNQGSHNMRTFEIPAADGLMLAEFSQEQADFFLPSQEACFFKDLDDLVKKTKFLLENPKQREIVRQAGYQKVQEYDLETKLCNLHI